MLNFYADELTSFNNRLSELIQQSPNHEVLAQAEHFQNQFIRQKEVIDILRHDVRNSEKEIIDKIAVNPVASDHQRMLDDRNLRDAMETFRKIFDELKEAFKHFLSGHPASL